MGMIRTKGAIVERRVLLGSAVAGLAGVAGVTALGFTMPESSLGAMAAPGPSPYGDLGPPNADGLCLPAGFTGRVVARSGTPVAGYTWHGAPDGGACFADGAGWIYVSNSELDHGAGGVGALRFDPAGTVVGAGRILGDTNRNCAGGATPWNTWLSCEETDRGYVYETDPFGRTAAVRRPAMGRFTHEAAAADPDRKVVYLTEDHPAGCLYRFVPAVWGDLSRGRLEVLTESTGTNSWARVPDPDGKPERTRNQVRTARRFNGGEGCYYRADVCYFTTKGDNRVWAYHAARNRLTVLYDDDGRTAPPLTGVDNITGTPGGDLYVAEDRGNMELCVITADRVVAPFLRLVGQDKSEITGPAFNPAGDRLYFSSQRGIDGTTEGGGITYEVQGPFRRR
jgi:secreted PhoX family phosphatase